MKKLLWALPTLFVAVSVFAVGPYFIGHRAKIELADINTVDAGYAQVWVIDAGYLRVLNDARAEAWLNDDVVSRTGVAFEDGSDSILFLSNNSEQCRISGSTGNLDCNVTNGRSVIGAAVRGAANGVAAVAATGTGYLQLAGVATGSLPTCDGTRAGSLQYDTTLSCFKACNGLAWSACLATGVSSVQINGLTSGTFYIARDYTIAVSDNAWSVYQPAVPAPEGDGNLFTMPYYDVLATSTANVAADYITCQFGTPGVTGGATTGVVIGIRDVTAGSTLCTCTLTTDCDSAVPVQCPCAQPLDTAAHVYAAFLASSTDCGTNPGQIGCTINLRGF